MTSEEYEILRGSVLFRGLPDSLAERVLSKYGKERTAEKGTSLLSSGTAECAVLLSGTAQILSASDVKPMILRFASAGDTIGIAGLFLPSPIRTSVLACGEKELRAYVLNYDEIRHIMNRDRSGGFRDTLLALLAKKIAFLNSRISCLTSGSAEARFAVFLLSSLGEGGSLDPGMSMTALADTLNMGRASLYRAVTDLVQSGILEYENNIFTVPDTKALENYCFGKKEYEQ